MKIAYLVFAYKNPQLLKRIVERLSSEDSAFFIHIDKKSDIEQFSAIQGANIFFSPERIPVYWGEFSGIRAIRMLMDQALASTDAYEYMVLLSGSEYPLRSKDYIHQFFAENRGSEFITTVQMPNEKAGKPLSRIDTLRVQSACPLLRLAVRALAKYGMARRDHRKYLGDLKPYAGNTWWALSREACEYIVAFERRNPQVAKFFADTFAPEEMYFHTILGNSRLFQTKARRNLLYEDWRGQQAHPKMIGAEHLNLFRTQDKVLMDDMYGPGELLFARKFSDENLDIIDKLDELIEAKEQTALKAT